MGFPITTNHVAQLQGPNGLPPTKTNMASWKIHHLKMYPPANERVCPMKRNHFGKDISSFNHQFSGDMLVFRNMFYWKLGIFQCHVSVYGVYKHPKRLKPYWNGNSQWIYWNHFQAFPAAKSNGGCTGGRFSTCFFVWCLRGGHLANPWWILLLYI